jgi:hypothetical protein
MLQRTPRKNNVRILYIELSPGLSGGLPRATSAKLEPGILEMQKRVRLAIMTGWTPAR